MVDLNSKKLAEAYILGIPFGIFGAHHFYLGRKFFGILYLCTLGLFGIGYLYDLVRMKWLVRHANRYGNDRTMVSDCYLIGALGGWFGAHHFYMGNKRLGIFYACTVGVFGVGWIVDLVRMKWLVKAHNRNSDAKSVGTAYILAFSPFGIFGAYHYYLRNYKLGIIYSCTFGIFGIGWFVDLFRMKKLVRHSTDDLVKRSVTTAYIMSVPPFGIFGAYHYYLGNYGIGIVHTLTLGIFGIGWIVDLFRMKGLVDASNDPTHDHGQTKITAYVLCVSPLGLFGAHHFFLERYFNGVFYLATFGMFGVGWIFDMLRLPVLFERYAAEDEHKYPDEAYMYWFPFGLFGLHHFYLGNKRWGIIYLCSLGCLAIGWIIDGFRLPFLLREFNENISDTDMHPLRFCKPTCRNCSIYRCKRGILSCFSACTRCETFSLSKSPSANTDASQSTGQNVKDDFDVIKEMYPNENHDMQTGNGSACASVVNDNEQNGTIATIEGSPYQSNPEYDATAQAYDNGAYPGDPGYDSGGNPNENGYPAEGCYPETGYQTESNVTYDQEPALDNDGYPPDIDDVIRHHEHVDVAMGQEEMDNLQNDTKTAAYVVDENDYVVANYSVQADTDANVISHSDLHM